MAKVKLDDLLLAIHQSVVEAQSITERQHIDQLIKYFDWPDGEPSAQTLSETKPHLLLQGGKPKTINIEVPNSNPHPNAPETQTLKVPLISLVPPSAIKIKNMVVEFKVALGDLSSLSNSKKLSMHKNSDGPIDNSLTVDMGGVSGGFFGKKSSLVKVRIEFEGTDPAESFMRINDHLVKSIV